MTLRRRQHRGNRKRAHQLAFEGAMGRLHDDDDDDPVRGWTYHCRNKGKRIFIHLPVILHKFMYI